MPEPGYDIAALRQRIPLIASATIPMNNCSQSPQTDATRAAAERYLESWNRAGMDWDSWMEEVRLAKVAFAALINASADDIAVFSSVSESMSAVASALDFSGKRRGVVVSELEFPTTGHIWLAQERRGAQVSWVAQHDGMIETAQYDAAIDHDTAIVAACHGYYLNGFTQDIDSIVALSHARGALVFVDAYQTLGVQPINVRETGVDFLASGNLKYLMGVPGIAFLYVRPGLAATLEPTVTGWFGRSNPFAFDVKGLTWSANASRFDSGTPPIMNAYIARAGMEIIAGIGVEKIRAWHMVLAERLRDGGRERGLTMHGTSDLASKTANTAFVVRDSHAIEHDMRERGVLPSARGPVIRLAPHFYNTLHDVDTALDLLAELTRIRTLMTNARETFTSRFGTLMTMIGVAVGLGNIWRFPYMVGKFGGAAFVILYTVISLVIGVPGLMAEWALGRHTGRGPVGAFALGGLPFGKAVGWFFFAIVCAATAYYTAVIGWVLYFGLAGLAATVFPAINPAAILPPDEGFNATSFFLQMGSTATVILTCAMVLRKGLRAGIEKASTVIMPALLLVLLVLIVRALTLPGAMAGVDWYILKFSPADIDAKVVVAALGQVTFSLSLGGTFMVVYGSYLKPDEPLGANAVLTALSDTGSGLLAGLAIIPAIIALGMEPSSGPALIFSTLPDVFRTIPAGWLFGFLFFAGLFGAGYLSDIAAFEVLVAGLTDSTRLSRDRAVWIMAGVVFVLSIPPSINNAIFVPWDLTFGSGMQTLGALMAVITIGWCVNRSAALKALAGEGGAPVPAWMFYWIRFGIPAAILSVGIWWLMTSVFGTISGV